MALADQLVNLTPSQSEGCDARDAFSLVWELHSSLPHVPVTLKRVRAVCRVCPVCPSVCVRVCVRMCVCVIELCVHACALPPPMCEGGGFVLTLRTVTYAVPRMPAAWANPHLRTVRLPSPPPNHTFLSLPFSHTHTQLSTLPVASHHQASYWAYIAAFCTASLIWDTHLAADPLGAAATGGTLVRMDMQKQ